MGKRGEVGTNTFLKDLIGSGRDRFTWMPWVYDNGWQFMWMKIHHRPIIVDHHGLVVCQFRRFIWMHENKFITAEINRWIHWILIGDSCWPSGSRAHVNWLLRDPGTGGPLDLWWSATGCTKHHSWLNLGLKVSISKSAGLVRPMMLIRVGLDVHDNRGGWARFKIAGMVQRAQEVTGYSVVRLGCNEATSEFWKLMELDLAHVKVRVVKIWLHQLFILAWNYHVEMSDYFSFSYGKGHNVSLYMLIFIGLYVSSNRDRPCVLQFHHFLFKWGVDNTVRVGYFWGFRACSEAWCSFDRGNAPSGV
ncbi:hypothetical protein L1987_77976 [Smallanthus sonchifolius]|uniref:Uncharacterized protein n=1 Tax=Smallanthus sonchifolius TaxID=185202 RepID=A0ACB8ZCF8_9ASTR|nr:hypothetical protein L1987_77976 [Smallanthus sonchifolius]